jgi:hypothetical protein
MLLGQWLLPGMDRLTIVPDGDLDLLPFAALPEDGCDAEGGTGKAPVAKRQIMFPPSLSVLLTGGEAGGEVVGHGVPQGASAGAGQGGVTVFADPVFDPDDTRVDSRTSSDIHGGRAKSQGKNASTVPVLPRLFGTQDEARAIAEIAGPGRATLYMGFDANLQTLISTAMSRYQILHIATHGVLDPELPGFPELFCRWWIGMGSLSSATRRVTILAA